MAQRFGGKYSPQAGSAARPGPRARLRVDPVGGRANLMFVPPVLLLLTSLTGGALALTFGLAGAATLTFGAWLLRDGLRAEAAYAERKVARPPAAPRKMLSALATGIGTALAVAAHQTAAADMLAPLLFGACTIALHIAAFGIDPLRSKGLDGADTFQRDRVARVVDEAEQTLDEMTRAIRDTGDREAEAEVAVFQSTARALIRTVEDDPRDLTGARKYLSVYLTGARDATIKFAAVQGRSDDSAARQAYFALLDDLEKNFAARTEKLLVDDRSDLTIEIDVLRERLAREGVRPK